MKIRWNGHASFTITANDGTAIVTDPYDPSGFGGVLKHEPVSDRADAVLVSHDHADHNYVEGFSGSPQVLKGSGQAKGDSNKCCTFIHISARITPHQGLFNCLSYYGITIT